MKNTENLLIMSFSLFLCFFIPCCMCGAQSLFFKFRFFTQFMCVKHIAIFYLLVVFLTHDTRWLYALTTTFITFWFIFNTFSVRGSQLPLPFVCFSLHNSLCFEHNFHYLFFCFYTFVLYVEHNPITFWSFYTFLYAPVKLQYMSVFVYL